MKDNVTIRKMQESDLEEVLIVENLSFQAPWTKNIFLKELADNPNASYFVLKIGNLLVGYAGLWLSSKLAQVTNIAIHPAYRRKQLGEKLFRYLCHYAILQGAQQLSLEVRASNIAAQKMYRKFGLVPAGIHKRYYTDNDEDAIIMWVNLI